MKILNFLTTSVLTLYIFLCVANTGYLIKFICGFTIVPVSTSNKSVIWQPQPGIGPILYNLQPICTTEMSYLVSHCKLFQLRELDLQTNASYTGIAILLYAHPVLL